MKCDCIPTGNGKLAKVCDTHKAFVDAATLEASQNIWNAAIHVYEDVREQIFDMLTERHRPTALITATLYRNALQKKVDRR